MRLLGARYEDGIFKPETPLALTPGQRVGLIVVAPPEPRRWDLDQLARSGANEDRDLAEQGLAEWAVALARVRTLTEEELAELELATDEALGRVEADL